MRITERGSHHDDSLRGSHYEDPLRGSHYEDHTTRTRYEDHATSTLYEDSLRGPHNEDHTSRTNHRTRETEFHISEFTDPMHGSYTHNGFDFHKSQSNNHRSQPVIRNTFHQPRTGTHTSRNLSPAQRTSSKFTDPMHASVTSFTQWIHTSKSSSTRPV